MGFTQGKNDPCMFVNDTTGITVALHVDDGLVRGTPAAQTEFYADLAKRFKYANLRHTSQNSSADVRGVYYSGIQRLRGSPHALD